MSNPPKANHSNEYFNSILNQLQSMDECCECKQVLATNNNNKTSRHARRERKPHFRKCYLPSPLRMHDAKCITAEEKKIINRKTNLKRYEIVQRIRVKNLCAQRIEFFTFRSWSNEIRGSCFDFFLFFFFFHYSSFTCVQPKLVFLSRVNNSRWIDSLITLKTNLSVSVLICVFCLGMCAVCALHAQWSI